MDDRIHNNCVSFLFWLQRLNVNFKSSALLYLLCVGMALVNGTSVVWYTHSPVARCIDGFD